MVTANEKPGWKNLQDHLVILLEGIMIFTTELQHSWTKRCLHENLMVCIGTVGTAGTKHGDIISELKPYLISAQNSDTLLLCLQSEIRQR